MKMVVAQHLCLSLHEHGQLLAKARHGAIAKKQELRSELEALEAKHKDLVQQLQEEQATVPPV
eukprot:9161489-Lingulodinium_polyedra.AAC.1